jgi:hypothetical protein
MGHTPVQITLRSLTVYSFRSKKNLARDDTRLDTISLCPSLPFLPEVSTSFPIPACPVVFELLSDNTFVPFTFPSALQLSRSAINHPPHFGLGTRQTRAYDLDFTRYHIHDPIPSRIHQRPTSLLGYRLSPATHRCDPFYYRIDLPQSTVGPGDELPISVSMVLDNEGTKIQPRSMSVTLERRLEFYEATGSHSHGDIESIDLSSSHTLLEKSELSSINTDLSSSSSSILVARRHFPNPATTVLPSRSISTVIVNGNASDFTTSNLNHVAASLNLALPAKPAPSQWPIGESLKTNLASIRFFLCIKVNS